MARPKSTDELASIRKDVLFTPSEWEQITNALPFGAKPGTFIHDAALRAIGSAPEERPSVPLWGAVKAGTPEGVMTEEVRPIYCSEHPVGSGYGYIEVQGDSMNKQVPDGALALIHKQIHHTGSTVAVRLEWPDKCEFTLKIFVDEGDGVIRLEPDSTNPEHKTIWLSKTAPKRKEGLWLSPERAYVEGVFTGDYIVTARR